MSFLIMAFDLPVVQICVKVSEKMGKNWIQQRWSKKERQTDDQKLRHALKSNIKLENSRQS